MSDRTAASIFADVFCVLAKRKNQDEARSIAAQVWPLVGGYDCDDSEMEADAELVKLGLAKEVPDRDYPGEKLVEYAPHNKRKR